MIISVYTAYFVYIKTRTCTYKIQNYEHIPTYSAQYT